MKRSPLLAWGAAPLKRRRISVEEVARDLSNLCLSGFGGARSFSDCGFSATVAAPEEALTPMAARMARTPLAPRRRALAANGAAGYGADGGSLLRLFDFAGRNGTEDASVCSNENARGSRCTAIVPFRGGAAWRWSIPRPLATKIPVVRIAVDPKGTAFLFSTPARPKPCEEATEESSSSSPSTAMVLYREPDLTEMLEDAMDCDP
mmetsp:Transcript_1835/g.4078  ORF Transcript_1835/g.4078 Transcript_1835/m.4078 type:complete len:206 (+) Transcript_1835:137-754(+)